MGVLLGTLLGVFVVLVGGDVPTNGNLVGNFVGLVQVTFGYYTSKKFVQNESVGSTLYHKIIF